MHQRCPCFLSLVHKYGKNSLQPLSFLFFLSTKAFVKARKRQVGLTRRVTPCSGAITNLNARECWYASDSEKQNLDRMRDKITFSSVMAKCWHDRTYMPFGVGAQTRAPTPNGI